MKALPAASASSIVRLEGLDLEPQLLGHGREDATTSTERRAPATSPSSIRDCDDLDLAVAVQTASAPGQRGEHGCVERAGTIEPRRPAPRGPRLRRRRRRLGLRARCGRSRPPRVEEDLVCAAICERPCGRSRRWGGNLHPAGRREERHALGRSGPEPAPGPRPAPRSLRDAVDEAGPARPPRWRPPPRR